MGAEFFSDVELTDDEAPFTEPAMKKKYVPSKELLESLNKYTGHPLKNKDHN